MSRGFFIDILFLKSQLHSIYFSGIWYFTSVNKLCEFPLQSFRLVILCIANRQFTEFDGRSFCPPSRKFCFHEVAACSFYGLFGLCYIPVFLVEEVFFRKPLALLPLPKGPIFYIKSYAKTAPMRHLATRKIGINQFVIYKKNTKSTNIKIQYFHFMNFSQPEHCANYSVM